VRLKMNAVFALALMAAAPEAVLIRSVTDMLSGPDENADVVSQALYGTTVAVLEERGEWARIRTPDDYPGWIPAAAMRRLREGETPYASGSRVARVESLFANLYRDPDVTRNKPLLTVAFETKLEVARELTEDEGRWLEIRLPDGRKAWVQRGDVTFETKPLSVDAAIAVAKRFLGLPYYWGGTSTFGYDCSGFTQMLYRRMGIAIPRDSRPQARWEGSRAVDRSDLLPGDLLYFGSSPEKISHTGMYIGGGEFIHATTHEHPVVQISRLDEAHWSGLLVACRRLK
jgi:gamma-D-glutamyl-L-lysine dipeptidyl-peptidase